MVGIFHGFMVGIFHGYAKFYWSIPAQERRKPKVPKKRTLRCQTKSFIYVGKLSYFTNLKLGYFYDEIPIVAPTIPIIPGFGRSHHAISQPPWAPWGSRLLEGRLQGLQLLFLAAKNWGSSSQRIVIFRSYPLVNIQKTMENHHFSWENPLFQWSFSIAMLNYQRLSKHIKA